MRASDADRDATVERLQEALAAGRLGFDEAGSRMTAAYAARFVAELADLTADLPCPAPPRAGTLPGPPHGGGPVRGAVLLALLATVAVLAVLLLDLLLLALGGIALHDLLGGPGAGRP